MHWLSEYLGFVAMNIIDFIQGAGFLYLFYLMGMKTREEDEQKEDNKDRGLYSINLILTSEEAEDREEHRSQENMRATDDSLIAFSGASSMS